MLYDMYEFQRSMLANAGAMAGWGAEMLGNPANPFAYFGGGQVTASALEVFAHALPRAASRCSGSTGRSSTGARLR